MRAAKNRPPRLAEWLLAAVTDSSIHYSAAGDFEEQFQLIRQEHSLLRANVWYWWQILRSTPAFIGDSLYWSLVMIKNYLKMAYRSLLKNKSTSFINLFGLSTTIASTIVIFLFIDYMFNLDSFHEHHKNIFMVESVIERGGEQETWGHSPVPLGPALARGFPQVTRAVRVAEVAGAVRHGDNIFTERISFVDSEFLDMFTFPLMLGEKASLADPNALIITEPLAVKYFGAVNPIGEQVTLIFDDDVTESFFVKGVAEKLPNTSSFGFGILANFDKQRDLGEALNDWSRMTSATFVQLDEPRRIDEVASRCESYLAAQNAASPNRPIRQFVFDPLGNVPMRGLEIKESFTSSFFPGTQIMFSILGFAILALACFNFVNIAVASASQRLPEIGIRKVIGSRKTQLVWQFIGESLLLFMSALIVGVALADFVFVPGMNDLLGGGLRLELDYSENIRLWVFFLGVLLLTGLGAGAYPAFYISSFQPVRIFRGNQTISGKKRLTRVSLVFQYAVTFILIVLGVGLKQNGDYQRNRDWGYDQQLTIVLPVKNSQEYTSLRNEMAQNPNVLSLAGSANHVGKNAGRAAVEFDQDHFDVAQFQVGPDYLETMRLRLMAGRTFDRNLITDLDDAVIVNQTLADQFNWDSALGKRLQLDGRDVRVVGVLEDFHYKGFIFKIEPTVIRPVSEDRFRYLAARIAPGKANQTADYTKQVWSRLIPHRPYEGFFQDTVFDAFHLGNERGATMTSFTAFIALTVSCMGLFGLVSLNIAKRMKEISIRKVLGASVASILRLINKEFLTLLTIATLIAAPLSFFMLKNILDLTFQYRMPVGPAPILLTAGLVFLAAGLTIFSQVYKGARANPVDGLRSE